MARCLELYSKIELTRSKRKVITRLQPYVKNPLACDLIGKFLCLDSSKRFDADLALNHDFFWTDPIPCSLENMLLKGAFTNYVYKTR